jgi:mycofactocin precursor
MVEQVAPERTSGGSAPPAPVVDDQGPVDEVDDLLVEEVSIDGMCGVY